MILSLYLGDANDGDQSPPLVSKSQSLLENLPISFKHKVKVVV